MSNIDSIMAGSRMDQIFLKGLEDVIRITYFDDYMEDDTEDDTEDNKDGVESSSATGVASQ
jgi:hypothetical protein